MTKNEFLTITLGTTGGAFTLLGAMALTASLAAEPAIADDNTITITSPAYEEEDGDLADERLADIEWVLANNPVLMQSAVTQALRNDPGIVKEIIRDTLMRNPELVIMSLQEYQRQQQAGTAAPAAPQAAADDRLPADFLERARNSDDAPVRGNPRGTVTLVEFADYNCGYCRAFSQTLDALIAANPDLRVVHREWPILSQGSVAVARLALAAQEQDAYEAMHKALMNTQGELDEDRALAIAANLGLDTVKLQADAEKPMYWEHIQRSAGLASEVNLQGTPGLIIADQLARGLITQDQAQPIIDAAKIR